MVLVVHIFVLLNGFSGPYFRTFETKSFPFVVAICDQVHDVEAKFHLSYLKTASGNLL